MTVARARDLKPYRTGDGSFTLRSEQYGEGYHSVNGAVIESTHVFISAGSEHVIDRMKHDPIQRPIELLEIGLGTGLNMLLTWIKCLEGKCAVNYTALEPFPLNEEILLQLAYWDELAWPALKVPFLRMMTVEDRRIEGDLSFERRSQPVQQLSDRSKYDLVFYDAFGPATAPEMWTADVLHRVHDAMKDGGVLVTYCAKGEVRRTLASIGFTVERLQGPPGKREMIRATK